MRLSFCLLHSAAVFLLTAAAGRAGDTNIAFGRPVTASGATTNPAAYVTDGDAATFTHPNTTTAGFYYQIDLGQEYPLQQILLYSRINSNPDRLSKVRMSVFADNGGVPGAERWGYVIRPDGSNNPQGGVDVLTAGLHAAGQFRGRFIRIANAGLNTPAPQVAEIEVYEAPKPEVRYFGPEAGNITKTNAPGKPLQAVISWNAAGYTALAIDQGIGAVTGPAGSVTVSPAATTTYTLTATNGAGITTKTVTIGVDEPEVPPVLSEFLASNSGGLRDSEGKRPDWIEIRNPNVFAINLAGYYLTDDAAALTRWRFPAFSVPGNGYAVVFADSSTAPRPALETPHTNFSLSASGEFIGLVAPDGTTVLSKFPAAHPGVPAYPPQSTDHSYGFSGGEEGFFAVPTPNAPNGPRYDGVVAPVVFSVPRGFYTATQQVAMTCATPGAEIRYTINGAVPSATTGTVYTGPVTVSTTRVLRAAAFRSGWVPADVNTQTYLFTASVISSTPWMNSSIVSNATYAPQMTDALKQGPSMSLTVGPGVTIDGAADKVGVLEWVDPAGGPGFQIPCGAQLFGGAFTNFAKKSFRLSFKGEYGASKLEFPLFAGFDRGLKAAESFDQIELRNGSHDMVDRGFYMSNIFTDATMLDMGSFAPHGRFVHLYINGAYWGLYHLRERWSADMMSSYYGGEDTDYESVNGNLNVGGWADPGQAYDGTDAGWTRLKTLARSGPDTWTKLKPYLDVPQYADYMTMFMFGDSEDEYRCTGPVAAGHGYKFILNDADGYLRSSAGNRTARGAPGLSAGDGPGSLFSMLYKDGGTEYRMFLADRIHRSYITPGGALTPARNAARLTELCAAIDKAIIPECARWNYRTPANWASSRDAILSSWFPSRTNTVLGFYRTAGFYPATAAPVLTPAGGTVAAGSSFTMNTSTGSSVMYYTTDGTDPRLPGDPQPNAPLVTAATTGKFRVPASADDGVTTGNIPGLLGYWPLNADANDAAGGFHGALTNGALIQTPGKFGAGAVELDGTNDYIALGDPAGLKILGQITIAAWVRAEASTGLRNIVNKGHDDAGSPNGEITLRINSGSWQGGYWAGSLGSVIAIGPSTGLGSAANDVNVWTHIALCWDGAAWRLYRNGVQIASAASTTGAVSVPTIGWAIGARGNGDSRFFDGQIDEVRLYNRGLSAAEIALLFNNTATATSADWALPAYNDSAWSAASGALGFAPAGDPLAAAITQPTGAAMQGVNASVYLRLPFTLTPQQRAETSGLRLNIRADDGYAAWLNGTRIASRNAPASLNGTSTATAETPDASALAGETVDLAASIPLLTDGTNVLAVQGLNRTAADDDLLLAPELASFRGVPGVAPSALPYSGAVTLTRNTIVRTRTYLPASRQWSALQETFYQVGPHPCPPGTLVVSELHFNPAGDGDGEFIELLNVSQEAVNLRGARFMAGIDYTFPANRDVLVGPGQRIVLVDSLFAFQKVHGWAAQAAGIYSGNLSNSGERLLLTSADGTTALVDFTWDGANPWPDVSDGGGRSLVLVNPVPGVNLNDPANWRPSLADHGNPGGTDALVFTGNPAADTDGDGLNAALEFSLGTSDSSPDVLPMTSGFDTPVTFALTLTHANGADALMPRAEAGSELSAWNTPVPLLRRELLPDGRLRSTWRAPVTGERLFFRLRVP